MSLTTVSLNTVSPNSVRRLLLAVLGLILLVGCADAAPTAPAGPAPDALIRAAAEQTTGAGSSRFVLTTTTAIGKQNVTLAGEGAYDYAKKVGRLTFDIPGPGGRAGGGRIEQRLIGNDLYLSLPQEPNAFYKLSISDVAGTSLGNSTDPIASLQALAGVGEVHEVGTEAVRDVQTTHYAGEYDVAQALAQAQGTAKLILETTLGKLSLKRVPFEAYLDEQGRMVKFVQRLELPASAQTANQPVVSTFTLELFDFGTAVAVTAPPAEEVKDGAPLLAALRDVASASPARSPASSPAVPAPVPPDPVPPAPVPPAPVPPAPVPPG